MITGVNRQILCYRTIAFADKPGIEGGNIGICANANLFAKIYILVITYTQRRDNNYIVSILSKLLLAYYKVVSYASRQKA